MSGLHVLTFLSAPFDSVHLPCCAILVDLKGTETDSSKYHRKGKVRELRSRAPGRRLGMEFSGSHPFSRSLVSAFSKCQCLLKVF